MRKMKKDLLSRRSIKRIFSNKYNKVKLIKTPRDIAEEYQLAPDGWRRKI